MDVKQVYELVNSATQEVLGESAILEEDLSNVVDMGESLFNANAVDNYVRSLVNHIGKVIFVNRPYRGGVPSVLMDGWEYGSVVEKISASLPKAQENESWELQDGTSYDPNIFYKPTVEAKFFNNRVTFEIPLSITERQVKESFSNAVQLNAFVSMLYNEVDKSMTVKVDSLIQRTINNFIAETLYNYNTGGTYTGTGNTRAVNLLALYNASTSPAGTLTAAAALTNPEFLRFAAYTMKKYVDRMSKISNLFNIGGKARFTPRDMLHFVLLSDFAAAADVYLQSDVWHNELTQLPEYETVPYWQGTGTDYSFTSISSINVTTSASHQVDASGILGVMFDRDALGVNNYNRRVTTNYNAKAEFWNNWYKMDAQYFNDTNENFVVFYAA